MFALIGALVGAGGSVYGALLNKQNAKEALKLQQQADANANRELVSALEILGVSVALFSLAYLVTKKWA